MNEYNFTNNLIIFTRLFAFFTVLTHINCIFINLLMKQAMCEYNFNENSTFFQLNVLFNAILSILNNVKILLQIVIVVLFIK